MPVTAEEISQLPSKPRGIGEWSILINNGYWRPRNFDVLIIELLGYALQGRVSKISYLVFHQDTVNPHLYQRISLHISLHTSQMTRLY